MKVHLAAMGALYLVTLLAHKRVLVNFVSERSFDPISRALILVLAGLHSSGSSCLGLCSGCSLLLGVCCCFVLDLSRLLGGPSTSIGVVGDVRSSVLVGLMG